MGEPNNYDNLDFCLNLHYDAIYNKKSDKNYKFGNINRKNIGLNDLKKVQTFDGSFVLGGGNLKYIGYFNERFHFKRKSHTGGFPCELAFGLYSERGDNVLNKGVLYNMGMLFMTSELIYTEKFKHSVLPIMLFDVDSHSILKLIDKFSEYASDANIDVKNTNMYCLVTEHYFKMPTLKTFLKKHGNSLSSDQWRSIFWQLLYALSKLNEKFKQFRHNMLNLDSIRLYIRSEEIQTYLIGNEKINVQDYGFELKLTDYDYATTTDYIENVSMRNVVENPYYDVHYFFNSLYLLLLKWQYNNVPKDIIVFIRGIVPDALLITTAPFAGLNETNKEYEKLPPEWSIPSMIIKKNKFFGTYRWNEVPMLQSPALNRDMNQTKPLLQQGGLKMQIFDIAAKQNKISKNKHNDDILLASDLSKFKPDTFDIRSLTESSISNPRMLAKNTNIKNKNPHINNINMDMETSGNKLNSLERAELAHKRKHKHRKSKKSKASSSSLSSEGGSNDKIYEQYIQTMKEMGHSRRSSSPSSDEVPKRRSKKRSHKHKRSRSAEKKQQFSDFSKYLNEKVDKLPFEYVDELPPEYAMALEANATGEASRSSRRSEMAQFMNMDKYHQQYMGNQYQQMMPHQQQLYQMPPQQPNQQPQQQPQQPHQQSHQQQYYQMQGQQPNFNQMRQTQSDGMPQTGGNSKTYKLDKQQFFF